MLVTSYTTHNDIRAALGVSADDVEDSTIALDLYVNMLEAELEDISTSLPSDFATAKASLSPTTAQQRFLKSAQVFATYSVAKQLTASLPLFAAKQVTDSKAGISRFDNPYKDTIKAVEAQYDKARSRLISAYGAIATPTVTTTSRVWMSVVSPAYDPVTNT